MGEDVGEDVGDVVGEVVGEDVDGVVGEVVGESVAAGQLKQEAGQTLGSFTYVGLGRAEATPERSALQFPDTNKRTCTQVYPWAITRPCGSSIHAGTAVGELVGELVAGLMGELVGKDVGGIGEDVG